MKFYLAKSLSFYFQGSDFSSRYAPINTNITPFCADDAKLILKLKQLLQQFMKTTDTPEHSKEQFIWMIDLVVNISEDFVDIDSNFLKGSIQLDGLMPGSCLQALDKLSNGEAIFQVEFIVSTEGTSFRVVTTDMIVPPEVAGRYVDENVKFPAKFFSNNRNRNSGHVTITVTVPDEILSGNYTGKNKTDKITNARSLNQHILDQEILSDVIIITGEGTTIKAHKNFLAAQSTVFQTMFQTKMSEALEHTVEIPDMSKSSVRAFLKFLYYQDTKDAVADCAIAFHLFHAGHKYNIKSLEEDMRTILNNKPCEWFNDVDVAVKLFLFARNLVPVDKQLKIKAIQILKLNVKKLDSSSTYNELFKSNTTAAMELCKIALGDTSI